MKHFFTSFILLISSSFIFAQTSVPKYLLFEHFTNTNCSVCAGQNPSFFNTIDDYIGSIHHISYHPPIPYQACVLYQANPSENEERTSFYSIFGTPRVIWNGTTSTNAAGVNATDIEARIAETSPISIEVEESGGINRTVNVKVKTFGEQPTGNLKIFAAILEKELEYNAPNGENIHHNVFREMISSISGDSFTAAPTGETVTLSYDYQVSSDWLLNQTYVIVFVQNLNTGEILNSGTRFDTPISSTFRLADNQVFEVFPNPITQRFSISLKNIELIDHQLLIFNTLGQIIKREAIQPLDQDFSIDFSHQPNGTYWLKLQAKEGFLVKKIIKS